jgi:hypothetical protein
LFFCPEWTVHVESGADLEQHDQRREMGSCGVLQESVTWATLTWDFRLSAAAVRGVSGGVWLGGGCSCRDGGVRREQGPVPVVPERPGWRVDNCRPASCGGVGRFGRGRDESSRGVARAAESPCVGSHPRWVYQRMGPGPTCGFAWAAGDRSRVRRPGAGVSRSAAGDLFGVNQGRLLRRPAEMQLPQVDAALFRVVECRSGPFGAYVCSPFAPRRAPQLCGRATSLYPAAARSPSWRALRGYTTGHGGRPGSPGYLVQEVSGRDLLVEAGRSRVARGRTW